MPQLIEIDELTRADHFYLTSDDACYFVGEYIARGGWQAGRTNDLVSNLKKSPELQGTSQWPHKRRAIRSAADDFRAAIGDLNVLSGVTVVPMPPSKVETDPLYDDRIVRLVERFCEGTPADIRRLLYQTESLQAFHQSEKKRDLEGLTECMAVNEALTNPPPKSIIVVDDVLTTGAHFRASKTVLQRRFPGVQVIGLFVARRVFSQQPPDSDDLK